MKQHPYRFTKADRILKRTEFEHLSRSGKKVHSRHFVALVGIAQTERCRLGLTVSKKVGKAAKRNRIKRIARETFRHKRSLLQRNWDIVLIAKKSAADATNQQLEQSVESVFRKLGTI